VLHTSSPDHSGALQAVCSNSACETIPLRFAMSCCAWSTFDPQSPCLTELGPSLYLLQWLR